MDLLRRVGIGHGIKNPCGLSPQQLSALHAELGPLGKYGGKVAEQAFEYVVDGESEGVLLTLGGQQGAASALGLLCATHTGWRLTSQPSRRQKLLGGATPPQAACWLRLARVWEAAAKQSHPTLLSAAVPDFPTWLEILLQEAIGWRHVFAGMPQPEHAVTCDQVEEMLRSAELPAGLAVGLLCSLDRSDEKQSSLAALLATLTGLDQALRRYPEPVATALAATGARPRAEALRLLVVHRVPLEGYAEAVTRAAVCSSKTVREAARPALASIQALLPPLLRPLCESGQPEERAHAVRLLWELEGEPAAPFLQQRRTVETAPKVLEALDSVLALADAAPAPALELPPAPPVPLQTPLTPALREAVTAFARALPNEALRYYQSNKKRLPYLQAPPALSPLLPGQLVQALEEPKQWGPQPQPLVDMWFGAHGLLSRQALEALLEHPDLQLAQAVRLLLATGFVLLPIRGGALARVLGGASNVRPRLNHALSPLLSAYRRSHEGSCGLREVAAILSAAGLDADAIGRAKLGYRGTGLFDWEAEAVWPYFAERQHLLEEALALRPREEADWAWERRERRVSAFRLLALFPALPPALQAHLWTLALQGSKLERPLAQQALQSCPGKEKRIIEGLRAGGQEERASAAEWLGELGCQEAVEPLQAALKKEKQELARGAMMSALERLGVPLDHYLDRDGLAAEARKQLAKGLPEALGWLRFELLPAVTWSDTGQAVAPETLTWLIVQSHKLKRPAPGPLLRRYCGLLEPAGREALGLFVLQSWIQQDTLPTHTREEAEREAEAAAQRQFPLYQKWDPDITVERLARAHCAALLRQCQGSAINAKGVLAVAAACGGVKLLPLVERYLKDWYGIRAAQSKALLQMLAWIEEPLAIQLLLSVAGRFRTRGIQQEAETQVQELAERYGWSRDELSDRTIPCAGLDAAGVLELDCGPRQYTARLDEELRFVLTNESGRPVKDLPAPGDGPGAATIRDTRKAYSGAKKELQQVLRLQTARLFESMCTQRFWRFEDFRHFLQQHPIVGHLVQRLVWYVAEDGRCAKTFRPLADGTLTDLEEEEVLPPPGAQVGLAHTTLVPEECAAAWRQHLEDYRVAPLFCQFDPEPYLLPQDKSNEADLADFRGYLIEAFKLRGEATRRGWARGAAEDGGWFCTYQKDFPTLELQAVLEFTGSPVPEENRLVALQSLSFSDLPREAGPYGGYGGPAGQLPLSRVPPVLLSECYREWREIAQAGTGFDAQWEKRVEW